MLILSMALNVSLQGKLEDLIQEVRMGAKMPSWDVPVPTTTGSSFVNTSDYSTPAPTTDRLPTGPMDQMLPGGFGHLGKDNWGLVRLHNVDLSLSNPLVIAVLALAITVLLTCLLCGCGCYCILIHRCCHPCSNAGAAASGAAACCGRKQVQDTEGVGQETRSQRASALGHAPGSIVSDLFSDAVSAQVEVSARRLRASELALDKAARELDVAVAAEAAFRASANRLASALEVSEDPPPPPPSHTPGSLSSGPLPAGVVS